MWSYCEATGRERVRSHLSSVPGPPRTWSSLASRVSTSGSATGLIRESEGCSWGQSNGMIEDWMARDLRFCIQNASSPCGRLAKAPIQCPTGCDEHGALERGISIPIDFSRWLHLYRLESSAGSMIAILESWLASKRSPARTIAESNE